MSRLARHVAAIFLLLSSSVGAQTATPEVPTPGLNDIAVVVAHPNSPTGAVILFNPSLCQQIGLACRFFAVHEHCHVLLGHHLNPGGNTMLKERDADRCAAQNAPPQAVHEWRQQFRLAYLWPATGSGPQALPVRGPDGQLGRTVSLPMTGPGALPPRVCHGIADRPRVFHRNDRRSVDPICRVRRNSFRYWQSATAHPI